MKKHSKFTGLVILFAALILVSGCKKKTEEPVITVASLITTAITNVTATTASSGGNITSNGGSAVTARGVCWSLTNQTPTIADNKTTDGTGSGIFVSNLTGLVANTPHYIRAYATNSAGTAYGNVVTFSTAPVPIVVTDSHTNLLLNTVHFSGSVTSDGGLFVTKRGFCWSSTNQAPTIQNDTIVSSGSGAGSFSGDIKGLTGQTLYYVRAYATNNNGTGYSSIISITTLDTTIADADNNHYRVVQIGSQVWMAENLKTTKYNDGTAIPLVTDNTAWSNLTSSGYCWYKNDAATYKTTYGALYKWYAVNTGKLAPAGWHVPTDAEWTTLATCLGDGYYAGGKMKSTGTIEAGTGLWHDPNTGATNESGFAAVPGGYRDINGLFKNIGYNGYWWSSTEEAWDNTACYRYIDYLNTGLYIEYCNKGNGLYVRCLRD
ncbi:MAG: fibrobacter succinogenes major paralogous domain-containing protein [Bacteroidetes bacterium]|nr:fibrobacter succinogenes major paralogous domain-containing protein [Bacteroidota bacterium]